MYYSTVKILHNQLNKKWTHLINELRTCQIISIQVELCRERITNLKTDHVTNRTKSVKIDSQLA